MILKLNGPLHVDNLRHYPSETVATLCNLLTSGAAASPDPHRQNFYDVEAGDKVFYIHLSPTGTVLLLACWRREPVSPTVARSAPLSEAVACC